MTFYDLLRSFVGRTVEVAASNQFITGTLNYVTQSTMQVLESPIIYGPRVTLDIQLRAVDYVRILP